MENSMNMVDMNSRVRRGLLVAALFAGSFASSGCRLMPTTGTTAHFGAMPSRSSLRFEILPMESQRSSLEYQTYSPLLNCMLTQDGFLAASPGNSPDVLVQFAYGIDGGSIESTTTPVYGQTGGGITTTTRTGTSTSPTTFGRVGSISRSRSIHQRYLLVRFATKPTAGKQASDPTPIYEIRVLSEGGSAEIGQVLPTMFVAAFESFPAQGGKVVVWSKEPVSFEQVMKRCNPR